jgi:hypothetical protein
MNDLSLQIADMISKRAWLPLGALVIGLVVRILKSDTKIPIDIPPRLRIWAAFGLGQVSGALEAVVTGKTWKEAVLGGLVQSMLAIVGQNVLIGSLRGGKEIPLPGLTVPGAAPSPGKPPSLPPKPEEVPSPAPEPPAAK